MGCSAAPALAHREQLPPDGGRAEARMQSSRCPLACSALCGHCLDAILLFTKTNSGGTDHVWFYDMQADGWSLTTSASRCSPKNSAFHRPGRWEREERARTTCPTCWPAGSSAGPANGSARAPSRVSVPKADIAPPGAMTCRSTATRKWCTQAVEHEPPLAILAKLKRLGTGQAGDGGAGGY